jgi:hypothetical protein
MALHAHRLCSTPQAPPGEVGDRVRVPVLSTHRTKGGQVIEDFEDYTTATRLLRQHTFKLPM